MLEIAVAAVFLSAAAGKSVGFDRFRAYISRSLPRAATVTALLILTVEFAIALGFLLQIQPAAYALCVTFMAVVSVFLAARTSIDPGERCNCFVGSQSPAGDRGSTEILRPAWYMTRNTVLLVLATVAAFDDPAPEHLVAVAAVVVVPFVVAAVAGVVRERGHLAAPIHPQRAAYESVSNLQAQGWWSAGMPRDHPGI
jgi:hypothetical protein